MSLAGSLASVDSSSLGLHRIVRAHHPEKIVDGVGDARLGVNDGDVDVAVHLRPGRRLGDDLEGDAGILGAKIAQDRDRQPIGESGRQRDLEDALRPALFLDDFAERLVDAVEGLRDDRQNMPSGLGQHQLLRTAFEQRHAEKILQHDHVPADRALRDRQAVGGRGEAQVLPGGLEGAQGVQRQPLPIHRRPPRTTREHHPARPGEHVGDLVTMPVPINQHVIARAVHLQEFNRHVIARSTSHCSRKCGNSSERRAPAPTISRTFEQRSRSAVCRSKSS